jgi:hypothetical protein
MAWIGHLLGIFERQTGAAPDIARSNASALPCRCKVPGAGQKFCHLMCCPLARKQTDDYVRILSRPGSLLGDSRQRLCLASYQNRVS